MHLEEDQEAARAMGGEGDPEMDAARECTCARKCNRRKGGQGSFAQMKRIPDFNLLNIPANIDMYEVMAKYIMPRLPDGYRIKTDAINLQHQQRRNSLMKYAMPELKRRSQKRDSNVVTELLEPTSSPRNLFPVMAYRRAFQVEVRETATDNYLRLTEESSTPLDGHEDRKDVYMLSRFLTDLDKLKLEQCPKFQKTLNESLILNKPGCGGTGGGGGGGGLTTTDDESGRGGSVDAELWANALKIIEGEAATTREQSRSSFIVGGDEEKCRFCREKEEAGKSYANMGHWSSRDVHDVKFNEDKFTIQFRTGRLGYFGFAANRYSNLPFQVRMRFHFFGGRSCANEIILSFDIFPGRPGN